MAFKRSISNRKSRRKINGAFKLQLTSMLDILLIVLIFLLKSSATSTNSFSSYPGLEMPLSGSKEVPPDSLHLIITAESITFEGNRILDFKQTADSLDAGEPQYSFKKTDLDEGNLRILPLYDALIASREKAELLRAKSKVRDENGQPLPFEGVLAIQADKRVKYNIIRKVMYTAGASGFTVFRFLAARKN